MFTKYKKHTNNVSIKPTIPNSELIKINNKEYAFKLLDEHIKGVKDNSRKIWTIYSFCLWYEVFISKKHIILNMST